MDLAQYASLVSASAPLAPAPKLRTSFDTGRYHTECARWSETKEGVQNVIAEFWEVTYPGHQGAVGLHTAHSSYETVTFQRDLFIPLPNSQLPSDAYFALPNYSLLPVTFSRPGLSGSGSIKPQWGAGHPPPNWDNPEEVLLPLARALLEFVGLCRGIPGTQAFIELVSGPTFLLYNTDADADGQGRHEMIGSFAWHTIEPIAPQP